MSDDVAANIQNPKDRLAIILERNQETYIDRVENKLTEIFSVKILSGTPEGTMERNKGTIHGHANGEYYHCRVRRTVEDADKPSPFSAKSKETARKLANMHPLAILLGSDIEPPQEGETWSCRYSTKDRKGLVLIERVQDPGPDDNLSPISDAGGQNFCYKGSTATPARAAGASFKGGTVGDYQATIPGNPQGPRPSYDREILSMEYDLPAVSELIQGVGYPPITAAAEAEHAWWQGKKETTNVGVDQSMKDKLLQYWNNVGFPQGGVDGCKGRACPWSAAYVSYLLRGASFTGGTSHVKYTKYNFDTATWKAFSIKKNKDKIKIQLGDILIKARYGQYTSWGSSHGDVIYKIKNNKAYSSGGNVSGTAKMAASFALTSDGFLSNPGEYVVILKKMK